MKLVDILARELKVWPESVVRISQMTSGDIWGALADGGFACVGIATLADDFGMKPVLRSEWQAAVDALNAPKVVEWDGVSLPPKGIAVEVRFACEKIGSEWPWHSGVVVASGPQPDGGVMVAVEANGFTIALRVTSDFIRPARTAEQVAAEERDNTAFSLFCSLTPWLPDQKKTWGNMSEIAKKGYLSTIDAGWQKVAK